MPTPTELCLLSLCDQFLPVGAFLAGGGVMSEALERPRSTGIRNRRSDLERTMARVREQAGQAATAVRREGCTIVPWGSAGYPQGLAALPDPPVCLFLRGRPDLTAGVALVGTRKATSRGLDMARRLGAGLRDSGRPVVSGLALGIDAAAHRGCLEAGGWPIAVTAAGGPAAVPPGNRRLARDVSIKGTLVAEFPPGAPVHRGSFPRRNRLIAALSDATVVVEAPLRSGALLTARVAASLHRPVGAVPGWVLQPQVEGCHELIRRGAALIRDVSDISGLLGDTGSAHVAGRRGVTEPALAPEQARVLRSVRQGAGNVVDLAAALSCSVGEATRNVLELAGAGLVALHPDGSVEVARGTPNPSSETR